MKQAPPTSAPGRPRNRQAQKTASCVDAGPGRRLVAATASSNSTSSIHRALDRAAAAKRCARAGPRSRCSRYDPTPWAMVLECVRRGGASGVRLVRHGVMLARRYPSATCRRASMCGRG